MSDPEVIRGLGLATVNLPIKF